MSRVLTLDVPRRGAESYLPGPGRGAGREPPRPSSIPIEVGGALIWSGGTGLGVMSSAYRQCRQPGDRLKDHQHAEHPRKPRHELDLRGVPFSQILIAEARGGQPAQCVRLCLGDGLLEELAVKLTRVDRELQLPRRQQYSRGDEAKHEGYDRNPTECVKPVNTNRCCAEERRHQGMGGEQRSGSGSHACHERLLVGQRRPSGVVSNLLKPGHATHGRHRWGHFTTGIRLDLASIGTLVAFRGRRSLDVEQRSTRRTFDQ